MTKLITLKRRISSIKNTRQITKAMELVSASKLRRAQQQATASRDYREIAYALLARLMSSSELQRQPLFARRPVRTRLFVVLTSNTGLAGAYNANVLKRLLAHLLEDHAQHVDNQIVVIGSKGSQLIRHVAGANILAYYPAFGDRPTQADIQPLLKTVIDQYADQHVDEVRVLYTFARSSISQEVVDLPLLPTQAPAEQASTEPVLNFEPDAETIVNATAVRLVEAQLWQAILESTASEHAMRMVAMKNATDNASELIDDYTLEYQTVRQGAITQEIAEISGGAEAMKD